MALAGARARGGARTTPLTGDAAPPRALPRGGARTTPGRPLPPARGRIGASTCRRRRRNDVWDAAALTPGASFLGASLIRHDAFGHPRRRQNASSPSA